MDHPPDLRRSKLNRVDARHSTAEIIQACKLARADHEAAVLRMRREIALARERLSQAKRELTAISEDVRLTRGHSVRSAPSEQVASPSDAQAWSATQQLNAQAAEVFDWIGNRGLPTTVTHVETANMLRMLDAAGFIKAEVPPVRIGADRRMVQPPAVVTGITREGRKWRAQLNRRRAGGPGPTRLRT